MKVDHSIRNLMARVADATLYYPCYQYKVWGYGEWIALEGLLTAARLCEHPRYMGFVEGLVAGWVSKRTELIPADHVAPGVALAELYRLTGRDIYLERALALGKLLLDSPRSSRGARLLRPDANRHIYVDCLYSDPPLFCRLAQITGDQKWFDAAANYACEFWDILVDRNVPLLYHGYSDELSGHIGLLWGRGAGWALLGLVDTLADMLERIKGREVLLANLRAMAGALRELQAADGAWHTVLDHPETYLENSIALLKRRIKKPRPHSFQESCACKTSFSSAILPTGQLLVSEATPEGDLKLYQSLGLGVFPWGQGPALRAVEERIRIQARFRLD